MQTIISLTSIPPRFALLRPVLESLLAQGADLVCLALPRQYSRFPRRFEAPEVPPGVTLLWSDEDFGPATKLLPALRAYPNAAIAICDDDCLYAPGWLDALKAGVHNGCAVTGQGWSVTRLGRQGAAPPYVDIAQGFSGVLTRAAHFDSDLFDMPEPAWPVDDIWISAQLAQRRIPLRSSPLARARVTPLDAPEGLQETRFGGHSRAALNEACAAYAQARYGIWPLKGNPGFSAR